MSSLPQNITGTFGGNSKEKKRPVSTGHLGSTSLYQKQDYYRGTAGFHFLKKKNSISSMKQQRHIVNQKGQLANKKSKIIEGVLIDNASSMAQDPKQKSNNSNSINTPNDLKESKKPLPLNGTNMHRLANSSSYKSKSDLFSKNYSIKKPNQQLSPNLNRKKPFSKFPQRSYSPLTQSSKIHSNKENSKARSGDGRNSNQMPIDNQMNFSFKLKGNSKPLALPNPLLNQKHQRAVTPILKSKFTLKKIVYNHQGQKVPKASKAQNKSTNTSKGKCSSPFSHINSHPQSQIMGYSSPYQMNRMKSRSKNFLKFFRANHHNHKTTVITMNMDQENDINTNTNTNKHQSSTTDNIIESKETQRPSNQAQDLPMNKALSEELKKKAASDSSETCLKVKSQLNNVIIKKVIKRMHEFSKTGYAGDDEKKVNQDNYFVFRNFVNSSQNMFMAVCDGHGTVGQEISGFLKENLPINLNKEIRASNKDISRDPIDEIITKIFLEINDNLSKNEMIGSMLSGSTCVSLIYTPYKVITANVGDSRAIVGKLGLNRRWSCFELTRDHKPSDPDESQRIISKEGRIEPMRDEDGSYIGPPRVWLKDKAYPGLAMSRSFGDRVAHSVGVCAVPEINEYKFEYEDKFFILASDGLFEFITNQEIVDIVKDFYLTDDIVGCCEHLYNLSCERWMKEEQSIDDITMIVVFLDDES